MRVWITADVHHGHGPTSSGLTEALARYLLQRADPADALVLAGDIGGVDGRGLAACLQAFDGFAGARMLVPGNHDLWSSPGKGPGSRALYEEVLPGVAAAHGFAVLDTGPVRIGRLGLAGCYGGYDYSLARLDHLPPEERQEVEAGWESGRFRTVFWNDYRYCWTEAGRLDPAAWCAGQVERLQQHLGELAADPAIEHIGVITHTGAHRQQIIEHPLGRIGTPAGTAWFQGLAGSARLGRAIAAQPGVKASFCGHTHHYRSYREDGRLWLNIGCTYEQKRWAVWEPETNRVELHPWVRLADP